MPGLVPATINESFICAYCHHRSKSMVGLKAHSKKTHKNKPVKRQKKSLQIAEAPPPVKRKPEMFSRDIKSIKKKVVVMIFTKKNKIYH